jgi:hypothetical protein
MREHIDLVEASTRPAKLETTPLPYGENDLMPEWNLHRMILHVDESPEENKYQYGS